MLTLLIMATVATGICLLIGLAIGLHPAVSFGATITVGPVWYMIAGDVARAWGMLPPEGWAGALVLALVVYPAVFIFFLFAGWLSGSSTNEYEHWRNY